MNDELRVLVSGAGGKMGRRVAAAIHKADGLVLAGGADPDYNSKDLGELLNLGKLEIPVLPSLEEAIQNLKPEAIVDFTNPFVVMKNIETSLSNRIPIVVGTTGLTDADLEQIKEWTTRFDTQAFVAPNFAIGAVLMMQFAAQAARYFPAVEIIELHHDSKIDAPSGTAMRTASLISQSRGKPTSIGVQQVEKLPGARGGLTDNIHIHSVRLPGLVAHQQVIFGGEGQTLSIKHDSLDRSSFMPGVILALRKIRSLSGLVVGLENLL